MKLRSGFVSNSSSSSFIILVTKEAHEEAMAKLHPWERTVVDCFMSEGKIGNQEICYGGQFSNDGFDPFEYLDIEEVPEELQEASNKFDTAERIAWDKYESSLPKDKLIAFHVGDGG
jgi:hypothetical protein